MNNKASGLDNISIKILKTGALIMQLLEDCSRALNRDRAKIWTKSGIIPLPKKGYLGDTGNYRGISLTSLAAKIYNKLLPERIRSHLDPFLRINQNVFSPKRSTVAHIVTLRRLIKGYTQS